MLEDALRSIKRIVGAPTHINMAFLFSKLALGQVVPYDQWEHMTPMDTMASKAAAFQKYMSEPMATAPECAAAHCHALDFLYRPRALDAQVPWPRGMRRR